MSTHPSAASRSFVLRPSAPRKARPFLIVAIAASPLFLVLPFLATEDDANYHFAFLFLLPILWGVFWARRALHLHPLHYALFALALLLHNLGALGAYREEYLGIAFDTYVHFYFGLVGGLLLERMLREAIGLRGALAALVVTLFVLGLGAIHEIVEVGSTLVLGDSGMYKRNSADEFDTHKDLLNNMLGCLLALAGVALLSRSRAGGVRRSAGPDAPSGE